MFSIIWWTFGIYVRRLVLFSYLHLYLFQQSAALLQFSMWVLADLPGLLTLLLGAEWLLLQGLGAVESWACPGTAKEAAVGSSGPLLRGDGRRGMGWLAKLSWAELATVKSWQAFPFPVLWPGEQAFPSFPHSLLPSLPLPSLFPFAPYFCGQLRVAGLSSPHLGYVGEEKKIQETCQGAHLFLRPPCESSFFLPTLQGLLWLSVELVLENLN